MAHTEAWSAVSGIQTRDGSHCKSPSSDWEHPVYERRHLIMMFPGLRGEMEYHEPTY